MKLVRKFGIYCAVLLALIAFILLMATPAAYASGYGLTVNYDGIKAIFGGDNGDPVKVALIAWILLLIGLLGGICLAVLPFIKAVKLDGKVLALIGLCVAVLFLVAGILAFCPVAEIGVDGLNLGAGWIIGGILLILSACGAAFDPVLTILGK